MKYIVSNWLAGLAVVLAAQIQITLAAAALTPPA